MRRSLDSMVRVAALGLVLPTALGATLARAQPGAGAPLDATAGHSTHGHVFNEGPRSKAYLMKGMPKVHFPISCKGADAQKFFDQGIGQLHGFWHFEAERSFRQVASLDPSCAMAYWGMAQANLSNDPRAREFMKKAVLRRDGADAREKGWIDAYASFHEVTADDTKPGVPPFDHKYKRSSHDRYKDYIVALENLVEAHPEDLEAKAFLVFAVWDAHAVWSRWWEKDKEMGKGVNLSSNAALDALAREVLAKNPQHPLHHYVIHLWDGSRARRALQSAFASGPSGPGIAHLWHMAAHTYTKLNRYADAAWTQEAAARVDHAYMLRDNVYPDQIHNYGHNNSWMVGNLAAVGRVRDALGLAKNLVEIPRHPRWNEVARTTPQGVAFAVANEKRENSAWFGRARILELAVQYELWDELLAMTAKGSVYVEPTDVPVEQAKRLRAIALAALAKGRRAQADEAATELEAVAKRAGDKMKAIEAMSSELRVLRALQAGQTTSAAGELERLRDLPKPYRAYLHFHAGETDKALQLAREAVEGAPNQLYPMAVQTDLLWRAGRQAEALAAFAKLRPLAAQADLDVPVFRRLAPVAKAAGAGASWRPALVQAPDVPYKRPPLESLGPLRWSPARAPALALPDQTGRTVSLAGYRGKPVVVIFYLGYGCIHCLEQLAAFAPAAKKFADAGISLVGVSVDSVSGLKKTFERSAEKAATITFPILSDESLAAFKAFRAYDDFEKVPLHGTFFIDGAGYVRWHDISYEPFTKVDFLLGEAKRLLRIPVRAPAAKRTAAEVAEVAR